MKYISHIICTALVCVTLMVIAERACAFEITYDGEFITDDSMRPHPVTDEAVPVTPLLSIVPVSPVTDATSADGRRHCWYMVDRGTGLKVMIASAPHEVPMFIEWDSMIDFLIVVNQEIKRDGGIVSLSNQCGGQL
jgi:hypothetical protein